MPGERSKVLGKRNLRLCHRFTPRSDHLADRKRYAEEQTVGNWPFSYNALRGIYQGGKANATATVLASVGDGVGGG
jgi:hypothetical protein